MTQQTTAQNITRRWSFGKRRGVCFVSSIHPTLGELHRGRIERVNGTWRVEPVDAYDDEIQHVTGDFADAQDALIAATTWADEPCDPIED